MCIRNNRNNVEIEEIKPGIFLICVIPVHRVNFAVMWQHICMAVTSLSLICLSSNWQALRKPDVSFQPAVKVFLCYQHHIIISPQPCSATVPQQWIDEETFSLSKYTSSATCNNLRCCQSNPFLPLRISNLTYIDYFQTLNSKFSPRASAYTLVVYNCIWLG